MPLTGPALLPRGRRPPVRDRRARTGAVLLVVGAVAVALAWLQPNPFATHTTVRALFADAGGLARIGAEVRIGGTHAGKVVSRKRDGDLSLVTMELDPDAGPVHTDATAELRPRLLFEGTSYVDLDPGSPQARKLGGDDALPVAQTRTAVSVSDALSVLDAPTRDAFATDAHALRGTLDAPGALQHTFHALPDVTRDAATVATAARGARQDGLRRAVAGFGRVTRTVAAQRADLIPLAHGLARTAAGAAQPALDRDLAQLPGTTADVHTGADALSGVLDRLDPLARDLTPAAARLGPTLTAVRPLARAATPALRDTAPLISDARHALADGARAAPGARRLLAAADPTLRILQRTLLTALERKTTLGTPAYLSFLGLFAGGGGASRPFLSNQGHFMRFGFRFLTGAGVPAPPCALLAQASPQLAAAFGQAGVCQS